MNIPTALVVGEALIDVVRHSDGSEAEHAGGSPMNVAITLGRLGRRVDLLTWFGKDARGDVILNHLGDNRLLRFRRIGRSEREAVPALGASSPLAQFALVDVV